ncbi:hypothetical protein PC110_g21016 [Phytophthora cactorum]|uniref:Reverse transcriptase RNase H-like domain-containing protein n=2 Tax=Phytophthora cactorum TaxID=29920 RepID=A0A329RGY7_9STRA|nr:hypothetical protein PC112_g21506 [Phytophthora cactorum]KAG2883918.1 hypothetical protein PC115_g21480 [Phytophthora cactorum]RAW22548.1 hypothetical protein PC110_g21016 [Phytophthora cactorum]
MLVYPKEGTTLCLLTGASDYGWEAIVTQGESVIEKEAYPIVLSCDDLDYLLMRPRGFQIYCNHRNLIHLIAPGAELKIHVRDQLLRWSIKLMAHEYTIIHIDGTSNLWADMIGRWGGNATPDVTRFKRITRSQT